MILGGNVIMFLSRSLSFSVSLALLCYQDSEAGFDIVLHGQKQICPGP